MKVISLLAHNIKRLSVVEIRPDGALVQITGANGSGKSSVLDALYFALAGKKAIDPVPVRQGEESALIDMDLGKFRVIREFDSAGTTKVRVESPDGAAYGSPQALLDTLLGALTFDPLEFTRMDAARQALALRNLLPEVAETIDQLQRENRVDFEARTGINRQVKQLEPRVKALKNAIPTEFRAPVDVSALLEEMQLASEHNANIERMKSKRADMAISATRSLERANELRAKAEELLREAVQLEEFTLSVEQKLADAGPLPEPVDVAELRTKIEAGQRDNRVAEDAARAQAEHQKLKQELAMLEEQSQTLTETMDERARQIRETIATAKMPIGGLSFSADFQVLYDGLPFQQASGAEQLKVSVAIAMAMNPKLRVLRIKDGSLLDESNLAMLASMADLADFQIWIERVAENSKVGIVMENGAVKAIDDVDVELAHRTPEHA